MAKKLIPKWIKWFVAFDLIALVVFLGVWFAPIGEIRKPITLVGDVEKGRHLIQIAGCYACHTKTEEDGQRLAGGPALETPFGTFYAPNITASKVSGIGNWDITRFERAVRQGVRHDNSPYYPAFPFSSYRSLTDEDVSHLFSALQASVPVDLASEKQNLSFPFNIRLGLKPWRWLFATTQSLNIDQSSSVGRGRYLVDAVGHCGECHNPRNSIGAFIPPYLGGSKDLPGGDSSPAIHGVALTRLDWTKEDLEYLLEDGSLPDGDYVGGTMVEVIDYGSSLMSSADREAIADFIFSLVR